MQNSTGLAAATVGNASTSFTIFCVGTVNSAGAIAETFVSGGSSIAGQQYYALFSRISAVTFGTEIKDTTGALGGLTTFDVIPAGTPLILETTVQAANSYTLYICTQGNVEQSTSAINAVGAHPLDLYKFGSASNSIQTNFAPITLYDHFVYGAVLPLSSRQAIRAYLKNQWFGINA
jgi:hypothetical protein